MKLLVDIASQQLQLLDDAAKVVKQWPVSTAANGPGEQGGSMKTPRGLHVIRAVVGRNLPSHAVLRGRRPTGEIHDAALSAVHPERDWILSRALWLSGCQPGFNRLGSVDSMRRYIYIHGTPDDQPMSTPASHGCIRMRNADLLELEPLVAAGTQVVIRENATERPPIHVVPWPEHASLESYDLHPIGPSLPDSPVPGGIPLRWAAWREDGILLGVLTWKAGSGATLAVRTGAQVGEVLPLLWREAARVASETGQKEMRTVVKAEWLRELDQYVAPIATVADSAVLVRGWI
ncbi:L,D-transpeptidase [Amantichitinum ursilacus]|uniref:L,D-transpeptidase catalytic domain n=1 Tax=Amantichitinum ursilacus TaxID=857265 RepID=A0A0N0XNG2_9NEIS|nr:L,D-transpeptidase [Amantichitinum ursilacus]KPC55146.1 L,D-transpeptidase catalytic domain [Amantichitinum ursilacus]